MRIIGGKFKNRHLFSPKGSLRPTSENVREALFNICQHQIEEAYFLDLFAGSGSIGIEALSRGALFVTFIEKNRSTFSTLKKNLNHFQLLTQSSALHGNVLSLIPMLAKRKEQFDLIYLDPPYANQENLFSQSYLIETLKMIDKSFLLKEEGTLFVEEMNLPLALSLKRLQLVKKRAFGKTILFQYQHS